MRKAVMLILGAIFLLLGLVGAILPVLPTTPFVLAGAGVLSASHPGLYARLERTRYFGEFIESYRHKTGISTKTRVVALCWLWGALILSAILSGKPLIWGILALVGICVSIHILTIRRKK